MDTPDQQGQLYSSLQLEASDAPFQVRATKSQQDRRPTAERTRLDLSTSGPVAQDNGTSKSNRPFNLWHIAKLFLVHDPGLIY